MQTYSQAGPGEASFASMTSKSVSLFRNVASWSLFRLQNGSQVVVFSTNLSSNNGIANRGFGLRPARTFATGKKNRPPPQRNLSRKERRQQTRELKRMQRKGVEEETVKPAPKQSSWRNRVVTRFKPTPRIPGGFSKFQREHAFAIGKRLPLFLVLAALVTSEETSPLKFDKAFGPSMLPTIHPLGDIYLRDTGAWLRLLGMQKNFQVGDVVAVRIKDGNAHSCKRIIGVAGDKVLRYGQFADMYKDRPDFGVVPPSRPESYNLDWEEDTDTDSSKDISRKVTVPPMHVWVEGDNPLFSVDSRHYGPVSLESVRGRVLMRVWPFWRKDGVKPSPVILSRDRPVPLTKKEVLVVRYNLYQKSPPVEEKPTWQ